MSEMVERIAKIIAPGCWGDDAIKFFWELWAREGQEKARRQAVLILAAMRDPTPKMLRASAAAMSPGKRPTEKYVTERAKHGIRYRAMIDEALK